MIRDWPRPAEAQNRRQETTLTHTITFFPGGFKFCLVIYLFQHPDAPSRTRFRQNAIPRMSMTQVVDCLNVSVADCPPELAVIVYSGSPK
jgi:hypothetical protein